MTTLLDFLRRFSIHARMRVAIFIVLGLVAMVALSAISGQTRLETLGEHFMTKSAQQLTTLGDLRASMVTVRKEEKDVLTAFSNPKRAKEQYTQWQDAITATNKALDELLTSNEPAIQAAARKTQDDLKAYLAGATPVVEQVMAGGHDSFDAANKALVPAKAPMDAAEEQVVTITAMVMEDIGRSRAEFQSTVEGTHVMFGAVLFLVVVVVVPTTLLNARSITLPLRQARDLAEAIASGDLRPRSHTASGRDETASLLRALEQMRRSLSSVVGQVREASDAIGTSSGEVAAGNADLSHRTEQTASNLQQTASSMEELTATVKQSADSAGQANQLAASAADAARRGGEMVAQVVSTMGEINTSSRRVVDIIGTIDGISFQTNILALNAAVEAARAGEQGRGFAVVAGEVRSLAQRSAAAAREIKTLITASVERVDAGTRQVQLAGGSMQEIVSGVQRVSDIIAEISAASREQSQGIGEVNTAVSHLDQMTQQNAALVEQSAAAAQSMQQQAVRLIEVVAAFRVDAEPAASQAAVEV